MYEEAALDPYKITFRNLFLHLAAFCHRCGQSNEGTAKKRQLRYMLCPI